MERTYYLPIKSENLGIYFSRALIAPAKYISGRNIDVQSNLDNALLISSKHKIGDSNCSLELVLTDLEKPKQISDDCWLFDKPLPITRVKHILFENEELRNSCITGIELNTAFIPKELVQIVKFKETSIAKNVLESTDVKDWTPQIDQFNQLMGGLAMMRLVTENDMNFSENYFSKLSDYNEVILKHLQDASRPIISNMYKDGYYSSVNKYFTKKVDDALLMDVAKSENQKIIRDNRSQKINLNSLDGATYIFAILRYYKANDNDEGRSNIDSLILNRFSSLKKGKGEEVAFYYGFNRGYSAFKKTYRDVEFKYRLDSKLDYYTIESIYQKQINGVNRSSYFPYLEWCPSKDKEVKNKNFGKRSHKYIVLDILVIGKKKEMVGSSGYIDELFLWFSKSIEELVNQVLKGNSFPTLLKILLSKIVKKVSEDKDWQFEEEMEAKIRQFESEKSQLIKRIDDYEKELSIIKREKLDAGKKNTKPTKTRTAKNKANNPVGTQTEWTVAEEKSGYTPTNKTK